MTTNYRTATGATMPFATEERTDRVLDALEDVLSVRQVPVLESWMAFLRAGLAVGVLLLSSRIIATPPPFVQGFALVLPAPIWATMLLFTGALSIIGRFQNKTCVRRNGSAGGFFVMCGLCGPLWIKAPGLCWMMALLLIPHVIVGLHLHRKCKEAQSSGTHAGGAS